jgi:hypothetical protein
MVLRAVLPKRILKWAPQGRQIMSFLVNHRITGQPMNTGSQQVSTR